MQCIGNSLVAFGSPQDYALDLLPERPFRQPIFDFLSALEAAPGKSLAQRTGGRGASATNPIRQPAPAQGWQRMAIVSLRRISLQRVGFLLHEVDGIPVDAVTVTDRRALTCEELAAKLSVHTLTVGELVATAELPPSNDRGEWPEQEIDRWLLSRPRA